MQSKAIKCGNSLMVLIPSYMAKVLGIEKGTKLDIELQNKKIVIRKENTND